MVVALQLSGSCSIAEVLLRVYVRRMLVLLQPLDIQKVLKFGITRQNSHISPHFPFGEFGASYGPD